MKKIEDFLKTAGAALQAFAESEVGKQLIQYVSILPEGKIVEFLGKREVTFVLGAGVSFDYKIAGWNALVLKVCEQRMSEGWDEAKFPGLLRRILSARFSKDLGTNPLVQARFATGSGDTGKFRTWVREAMYGKMVIPPGPTNLDALAEFASRKATRVIFLTYNYDDLLEQALTRAGVEYAVIYNKETYDTYFSSARVPVVHIHGFIPVDGEIPADQVIVMSEHEYNRLMLDNQDWRNLCQSQVFVKDLLMLGISLVDPNMRPLMDSVSSSVDPTAIRLIARQEAASHFVAADKLAADLRKGGATEDLQVKQVSSMDLARFSELKLLNELKELFNELIPGVTLDSYLGDFSVEDQTALLAAYSLIFEPLQSNDDHTFGLQTWTVKEWSKVGEVVKNYTERLLRKNADR